MFGNVITKYGWDNIEHHIIAKNITKEEAEEMEQALISELKSHDFEFGYNMTMGGLKIVPNEHSTKKRSKRMQGEGNHWFGKKHSEETKELISLNHHDCSGGNNSQAKKVYQFTMDGEFVEAYSSSKEANEKTGTSRRGISHACICNGVSNGFLWTYEDNIVLVDGKITMRECKYKPQKLTKKEAYAFTLDGTYICKYESCGIASKSIEGMKKDGISRSARSKGEYKGIKWIYKDDVIEVDNTFKIKEE